ncbi:ABC transporter permease [Duncaniella dubosii]|jgi:ABC-2 type transport system permease protein|uniref:ABC transporter permease n=1 Tax=Duncaniella dubosii TaxID=2518971 RepID=A0A4V1D2X4_9BACT|nr:ABC transporter permease [Duncaniella dubosii]QCD41018.1 ABC transporter permease [Duncaniella dubosii]ROS90315.1 ABC transporter permease [Muribaculaceae bacterium Isolate-080 (Janvier)]
MSKIGIVIEREYMERVKKKSFIITTILMPMLMLVLMALPAIIMNYVDSSATTVSVIDNSSMILPQLKNTESLTFRPATDATVDSALTRDGIDAVLVIPENILTGNRSGLKYYANGPSSVGTETGIVDQINSIIETERLKGYNIANLDDILESVKSNVSLTTVRADKDSEESNSSMFSYGVGIGMTFVLYMFLLIYGQMVMTSIIEEKGNRVLEVVVSSVKPAQLMMGKIVGVALVAVTQMVIWGILLALMSAYLLPALMPADAMADVAAVQSGNFDSISDQSSIEIIQAVGMLGNVSHILSLIALMTVFLVFGFLLYSSIFAAVGSSVDNIQDASQLTSFAVFPIIFGLIFAMVAATDPMGSVAFWMSMFPLTSPMVMVARIPFGIPAWEIALSLVLLAIGFIAMVWLAGKIYRVGIFMYGKKPSIKELIRWVNYK